MNIKGKFINIKLKFACFFSGGICPKCKMREYCKSRMYYRKLDGTHRAIQLNKY